MPYDVAARRGADYSQSTDPGAVGAKKTWLRTRASGAPNNEDVQQLFVRNAADDGWLKAGLAHWDSNGVLRWYVHDADAFFEIDLFDASGNGIGNIDFDAVTFTLAFATGTNQFRRFMLDATGWNLRPYGSFGMHIIVGSADPSAAAGVAAEIGSIYYRVDGAAGEAYLKASAADTAWSRLVVIAGGVLVLAGIPTADPHVVGQVWNSAGTLKISAG